MYVYIYMCVYTHTRTYIYYVCLYIRIYVYINTYTHFCVSGCVRGGGFEDEGGMSERQIDRVGRDGQRVAVCM